MYYTDRGGLMFYTWTYILNAQIRNEHSVCVLRVVCDSLQLHGLQLARLLCPWDYPDKNTGVRCHVLLQWIGEAFIPHKLFQVIKDFVTSGDQAHS